jgi:hypothetical protein
MGEPSRDVFGEKRPGVLRLAELLEEGLVERVAHTELVFPKRIELGPDDGDYTTEFCFTQNSKAP